MGRFCYLDLGNNMTRIIYVGSDGDVEYTFNYHLDWTHEIYDLLMTGYGYVEHGACVYEFDKGSSILTISQPGRSRAVYISNPKTLAKEIKNHRRQLIEQLYSQCGIDVNELIKQMGGDL